MQGARKYYVGYVCTILACGCSWYFTQPFHSFPLDCNVTFHRLSGDLPLLLLFLQAMLLDVPSTAKYFDENVPPVTLQSACRCMSFVLLVGSAAASASCFRVSSGTANDIPNRCRSTLTLRRLCRGVAGPVCSRRVHSFAQLRF